MKRYFILILTILLLFGCSKKEEPTQEVEMPTPFIEVKNIEELNTTLGFNFEVPESIDEISTKKFFAYKELGMAEVDYMDGEEYFAFTRKILLSNVDDELDSISGVYEKFDEVKDVGKYKISFINGIAYISDWYDKDYMYTLVMLNGASEEVILEISNLIK